MSRLAEMFGGRELIINLTLRELRSKYKRSVLGWAWSFINPLATMLIFTVVFRFFLKVPVPRGDPSGLSVFAFFLLPALLTWNFLSNGLTGSMSALLGNANLIKKVYFPREILVLSNVAASGVSLLIEMGVLCVALLIAGNMVLPWLPMVVVIMLIQAVFVLGVGLMFSVLNVYFRDVQHFVGILLQLWFYATPIVYPKTVVPLRHEFLGLDLPVRRIYDWNPMTRFADAYRDCLYHLRAPSLGTWLFLIVGAAISLAIGLAVFSRFEPRLAEEL